VREVTATGVNRNDEGKAERTDYSGGTKCLLRGERASSENKKRTLADTNFVAVDEAALRLERPVDDVAANVKHGGFLIVLLEIIIESIVGAVWTVVKAVSQGIRLRLCEQRSKPKRWRYLWDRGEIGWEARDFWGSALGICPPTVWVAGGIGKV